LKLSELRAGSAHAWIRGNILGLIAIFIALSGTAVATQVASKDGGASTAKHKKARRGPPGPQGPQGSQGAQGLQGPPGLSTGPAGGDLTGNFPNPTIGPGAVTPDKIGVIPAVRAIDAFQSNGAGGCLGDMTIANGTVTTLTWENDLFDTAGMHIDGSDCQNPARSALTIPRNGVYLINVGIWWEQDTIGTRYVSIDDNGLPLAADERGANDATGAGGTLQTVTTVMALNQGDILTTEVNQKSGNDLILHGGDSRSSFSAVWLGPVG
jgi:hypothetical protein